MSISTSRMLGKLGRSVQDAGKAVPEQAESDDAPQLQPGSTPKMNKDLDMQNLLSNALGMSSSKKSTPID